jgi:hypothetical protein
MRKEEAKSSLSAEYMILYIKNPNDCSKKTLQSDNFVIVIEHRINIQNSVFFYI